MKRYYFQFFLTICTTFLYANKQDAVDSLKIQLSKSSIIHKANIYNKLSYLLRSNSPTKCIEYAEQALSFAREINNSEEEASAYSNLGLGYYYKGDYKTAYLYHQNAFERWQELGIKIEVAKSLNNIGLLYDKWGDYSKAIEYHIKSLKIKEELDNKYEIAKSQSNIGIIYCFWKKYDKSLEYFVNALANTMELDDLNMVAELYCNIGAVHFDRKEYEDALSYFNKALQIDKELGKKDGVSFDICNIGGVYFKKGEYLKSLSYYEEALAIERELGTYDGISLLLNNIGLIKYRLKEYSEALRYFDESQEIAKRLNVRESILENYKSYTKVYDSLYDYKNAYNYFKKYTALKDSIYGESSNRKIIELRTKYESEKIEKENEILRKDNTLKETKVSKQRLQLFSVIGGLCLVAVLSLVILRAYFQKRKAHTLLGSQKNKLEDLNKELEVANSSKDKFFSIIAHDLKLPFNSLINISELLMKQYDEFDSKAIKNFILGINQSSHFAFNLLQNLLSWANSQTNRIEISPTSFDIKLLLEETLSLFSYNAHEKNIELISEIGSDTYVYADVNMVDTVVRNLISNAIKFTNAGGKISLMSKIVNNEVQISISDTGIGIKKVDIEKLFRFDISHSTTGTKMEKGTGLGLILCKEFIEKNNGKIFIESLWGRGSTFSITLPAGNKPLTQESKLPEMKTRIYNELSETLVFEEDKTIENFQNSENYKSNIEYFESNLLKQWNHVRINHFVHEVIEFSVSIREFGLRNKMTSIENYGNELNMYAKSFDIEKMEKNMAIFPDILKKLKK